MTEAEWLASGDPQRMLGLIDGTHMAGSASGWRSPMRASDRKLRLFACAISRRMVVPESIPHIEQIEDLADNPATDWRSLSDPLASFWCADDHILRGCGALIRSGYVAGDREKVAAILRDIVGNPLRPVNLEAYCGNCGCRDCSHVDRDDNEVEECLCADCGADAWVRLEDCFTPTALSLAQAAYDHRQPDGTLDPLRLAVLADALEEAGCADEAVLRHLRGWERCPACFDARTLLAKAAAIVRDVKATGAKASMSGGVTCSECEDGWIPLRGPHVRGCHVLDTLLGKE